MSIRFRSRNKRVVDEITAHSGFQKRVFKKESERGLIELYAIFRKDGDGHVRLFTLKIDGSPVCENVPSWIVEDDLERLGIDVRVK